MARTFTLAKYAETLERPATEERDVETLKADFLRNRKDGGTAILGMGDCLIGLKAKLPHGEWLSWLEEVDLKERAAQRLMKLAREFSNPTALSDLGATKALSLLVLPPDEREAFLEETHLVNGQEKSVADMTTRELEKAIRERDEARRAAEAAQKDAQTVKEELRELRAKPVDVAVEVDQEAVERARAEAVAGMEERVRLAETARREAETALEEVRRKLPGAAKKDDDGHIWNGKKVKAFEWLFEQACLLVNQMHGLRLRALGRSDADAEAIRRKMLELSDYARERAE